MRILLTRKLCFSSTTFTISYLPFYSPKRRIRKKTEKALAAEKNEYIYFILLLPRLISLRRKSTKKSLSQVNKEAAITLKAWKAQEESSPTLKRSQRRPAHRHESPLTSLASDDDLPEASS